jgi:soluble lytic murein transglycosylase-like protein
MFCLSRRGTASPPQPLIRQGKRASGAVLRAASLASFAAVAAMCVGVFLVSPAQAQIASYVDAHGRVIYINANPPAKTVRRHVAPVPVAPPAKLLRIADAAAKRNDLDPALVEAVIQTESNWNQYAVSSKGAFGLMQLIPSTAERYGVKDVFDPAQNVRGGTRYLRDLLDRYHGNLKDSLAAYNAGEEAVARFGGVPAYRETRNYVRKVTNTYFQSGSGHAYAGEFQRHSQIREVTEHGGRTIFTNE